MRLTEDQKRSLKIQNTALSGFHTVLMLITLYVSRDGSNLPLFDSVLFVQPKNPMLCPIFAKRGQCEKDACDITFALASKQTESLPYRQFCALFFFLSAFFHAGNACIWRESYFSNIEIAKNPYRWLEYSLSASCMYVALAWPLGVSQAPLLISSTTLVFVTMLHGELAEDANRPSNSGDAWAEESVLKRLKAHLFGWIPQLVAWYILIRVSIRIPDVVPDFSDVSTVREPPKWLLTVTVVQAVLFASFGFVQLYLIVWGKPSQYINGEYVYNWLSFVSKGCLGIFLMAFSAFTQFVTDADSLLQEGTELFKKAACT